MREAGHVGVALLAYAPIGALTLAFGAALLAVLGGAAAVDLANSPTRTSARRSSPTGG